MADLMSQGQIVFARADAEKALGVSAGAFYNVVGRQIRLDRLITPRQGFYVIVPEQFKRWGAPPPSWYIHQLMTLEQSSYYVGLLKAAELHGASHQAVMEFQVITNKRPRNIKAGRSIIAFYYRKDMDAIRDGIEDASNRFWIDASFVN